MKDWLLTTPLFKWAYRQGGIDSFSKAHQDIWSTMKDDVEKMADDRLKRKLEELLTGVDERLIVKLDSKNGVVFIGDERPDDSRLVNLKAEAEFLSKSDLWKILSETPKALAQKSIFTDGETIEAVRKGRSMIYTLDTQARILAVFLSYKK